LGLEKSAKLLLIRHGQTAGNKQRYVGWEDLPLDEVGRRQAHAVADLLREEPIHAVYSSPLIRAVETARPLAAGHHLDIRTREDLKEIDFGQFQGLLKTEQHIRLRHDHQFTPMPGGESLHDVYLRIGRFLDELRPELAAGRTVAVTGHYWSSRILAGCLSDIPFEEMFVRNKYKPENGSVYEMVFGFRGGEPVPRSTGWIEEGDLVQPDK